MCVLLGVFREFPVDPYYEPLAWFMIEEESFLLCNSLYKCILQLLHSSNCHLCSVSNHMTDLKDFDIFFVT